MLLPQRPAHRDDVEAPVFVRGLPLDTLQYELQDRMSRFGKLKACRCRLPRIDRTLMQSGLQHDLNKSAA